MQSSITEENVHTIVPYISEVSHQRLVKAYEQLVNARDAVAGVTVGIPGSKSMSVETSAEVQYFDTKYNALSLCPIRKSRLFDRFIITKKGHELVVKGLIAQLEETKRKYSRQTARRFKYGLISPLAFCKVQELPKYLGSPVSDSVFTLMWCAEFQQLSLEGSERGILEMVSVSINELKYWWVDGQADLISEETPTWEASETNVWTDLKTLALKVVCLLDQTINDGREGTSPLLPLLRDVKSHTRIKAITFQLKRLTLTITRLIFLRYEHLNDILPLFELIVPATYSLSVFLNLDSILYWETIGEQYISMLECYVSIVNDLKEALATRIGVIDDLKEFEISDNSPLTIPNSSSENAMRTTMELPDRPKNTSYTQEALQSLKDLGLREIELDLESEEYIVSGSFANIMSYQARDGDYKYAVKFLKRNASVEKLKTRLLREARRWVVLSHGNINRLLGICIHPGQELPGLVSARCTFSLDVYLERYRNKLNEKQKLGYLLDVAEGLAYMHNHEEKIAHGDIRPANILLAPGDFDCDLGGSHLKAVLTDFGVSDIDDDFDAGNQTTMQHTNDYYLAPELLASKILPGSKRKKRVTIKGDIYAFGCVFFWVLYGAEPFHYDRRNYRKIKKNGGFPARQSDVSTSHWEVLQSTWNSNKDKRPLAMELVDQLQSMVSFASH